MNLQLFLLLSAPLYVLGVAIPKRGYWDLRDVLKRHFSINESRAPAEYLGDDEPFADIENHDAWTLEDLLAGHVDDTEAALKCLREHQGGKRRLARWELFEQCGEHFRKKAGAVREKEIK